jgi:hypothetical protein
VPPRWQPEGWYLVSAGWHSRLIEQIGSLANNPAGKIGIVTSLVVPTERSGGELPRCNPGASAWDIALGRFLFPVY